MRKNHNQKNRNHQVNIHRNLTSYINWLNRDEELLDRYFNVNILNFLETRRIKEMHKAPKPFKSRFNGTERDEYLEIGIDSADEQLCICTKDGEYNGSIYLYGWINFAESYSYDADGNEAEYQQRDVYGFTLVAKNFEDFFNMAYIEG
jgi:hypothetical protein